MVHTYNPSCQEAQTRESRVQDQLGLHGSFRPAYIRDTVSRNKQKKGRKGNLVYIHNGVLFSHKEKYYVIFRKIFGEHHAR
jgi:hypothetical protein